MAVWRQVLRRLDRLYAPRASTRFPVSCSSMILLGFALSYHAPILGSVKLGARMLRPMCHWINSAHLDNLEFKNQITVFWEKQVEAGS